MPRRVAAVLLALVIGGAPARSFIREWLMVGPFVFGENEDGVNRPFLEALGSLELREGATVQGRVVRRYTAPRNHVEVERVYPGVALDHAAVYAVARVWFDRPARDMKLFLGTDDYNAVFVNGKPVHFTPKRRRWMLPEVDVAEGVAFNRGWNTIVLKAMNIVGGFSFFACIADRGNQPLFHPVVSVSTSVYVVFRSTALPARLSAGARRGTDARHWLSTVFSDPAVAGISNPSAVRVRADTATVTVDDFHGVGVQGDLFYWLTDADRISDEERAMLLARVGKLAPSYARLFLVTSWWNPAPGQYTWDSPGMRNLYRVLDRYRSLGAAIALTVWRLDDWINPRVSSASIPALAASTARLVRHLVRDRGYDNIRYLIIYNEPDIEYRRPIAEYRSIYVALDAALRAEGVRDGVLLAGPDESSSFAWFRQTAEAMADVLDVFDSHHYEGYDATAIIPWIDDRMHTMRELDIRKPFMIMEFGMWEPWVDPVYFGRFCVEYVITALNRGVAGLGIWEMQSNIFPGETHVNDGGLWRYRTHEWRVRPVYYAYALLSRNVRAGMQVLATTSDSPRVLAAAVRAPGGMGTPARGEAPAIPALAVLVSNTANRATLELSAGLPAGARVERFAYHPEVVRTMAGDELIAPHTLIADSAGIIRDTLRENTCAVYVRMPY